MSFFSGRGDVSTLSGCGVRRLFTRESDQVPAVRRDQPLLLGEGVDPRGEPLLGSRLIRDSGVHSDQLLGTVRGHAHQHEGTRLRLLADVCAGDAVGPCVDVVAAGQIAFAERLVVGRPLLGEPGGRRR